MKQQTKLTGAQSETNATESHTRPSAAREFVNADELLRFDAEQTILPPEIAERLKKSADEPPPPASRTAWWKRFF